MVIGCGVLVAESWLYVWKYKRRGMVWGKSLEDGGQIEDEMEVGLWVG